MNSISGIVYRPAAIQFGSNRRPVPSSPNEVRTEDDAVFNFEDMEGITPPPTPNRGIETSPIADSTIDFLESPLETAEIFRRTLPPPPDGSLPFMPMNLDESSFSNLHSPQETQETQRPRLMPRPRALHPDRNLAELLALNSSSESQNSRPGTPNSLPDQNPQNQPD
jgi:hypothetical protein